MSEPLHGLYMTTGPHPRDESKILAVISDGSPQYGHSPVTVLTMDTFDTIDATKSWFVRCKITRPWEPRS